MLQPPFREAASNDQVSAWNMRPTHTLSTERDQLMKSSLTEVSAWKITGQIKTKPAPPPPPRTHGVEEGQVR